MCAADRHRVSLDYLIRLRTNAFPIPDAVRGHELSKVTRSLAHAILQFVQGMEAQPGPRMVQGMYPAGRGFTKKPSCRNAAYAFLHARFLQVICMRIESKYSNPSSISRIAFPLHPAGVILYSREIEHPHAPRSHSVQLDGQSRIGQYAEPPEHFRMRHPLFQQATRRSPASPSLSSTITSSHKTREVFQAISNNLHQNILLHLRGVLLKMVWTLSLL